MLWQNAIDKSSQEKIEKKYSWIIELFDFEASDMNVKERIQEQK